MPKRKDTDGESLDERPMRSERMPPPLSEDLVAKLQGAVEAAQRRRVLEAKKTSPSKGRKANVDDLPVTK
jgi:indole-3-glycerol phosphate synthase